ncbi:hypothetical protein BB561_006545 [Smittium simulii]|uniref:Major facilitator superfamily (MFS) profile domain-containing protein n=1 Tax=Smittium simulii TaxID=133385 RepID=A0A2T9Y3A7_9FUNG|nr:hypothetical protein BB561_006545 [Smittium simulii]
MAEKPQSQSYNEVDGEKQKFTLTEPELTENEKLLVKSYLRKIDNRVLPVVILLYMCSSLDRSNIGVAFVNGLITALNLSSSLQGTAAAIFSVTYTIFEAPSNILLKKFKPRNWFSFIVVGWSVSCMFLALCKTSTSFIIVRAILGAFESGFTPGVVAYLPYWYARNEIGARMTLFFIALPIAGMFGAPIGGGLVSINVPNLKPYQTLFLFEGALTFLIGVMTYFVMQDYPDTATFFTPEERELALRRISASMGLASKSKVSNKQTWKAILDWKVYVFGFIGYGINNSLYIIQLYGPTLIKSMGYKNTTATFLSGLPFAFGFIGVLLGAYYIDKIKIWKAYMLALPINITGYALAAFAKGSVIRLVGICVVGFATCGIIPFTATWMSTNSGSVAKRMVAVAIYSSIGGFAGIATPYMFGTKYAPEFMLGNVFNLALLGLTMLSVIFMKFYLEAQNKRRETNPVDVSHLSYEEQELLNDEHPEFRYRL